MAEKNHLAKQQVESKNINDDTRPTKQSINTAGVIVLQWLSYAFWGWLAVGLIWLISIILVNAIAGDSVNGVIPYATAATLVLLPIAFVTDLFYRKYEPLKKTGAAMVIMVIHAVLFAILAIGTLVITVFTAINLGINTDPHDVETVTMLTALFATILYIVIFLRILNPFKSAKPSLVFGISMLAVALVLLIFAVTGPIIKSISTRQDRLIEANLTSVQTDINNYARSNNSLPKSLTDVDFSQKAKELIDKNLVEYTPDNLNHQRYQLCVTYTATKGQKSSYPDNSSYYLSTYNHPAGRVCYKVNANIKSEFKDH